MQGLVMTPEIQTSRRLPPSEAWLKPKDWIDAKTGLVLPGIEQLVLPTDDRNFILSDEAVRAVLRCYFKPNYKWGYDLKDLETKPDDHHFYYEEFDYSSEANGGATVPQRFRELPTVIGRMPRQLHNAIHDLTQQPEMPAYSDMKEYLEAYDIAYGAFKKLFVAARKAAFASGRFPKRRLSIANGINEPKGGGYDYIGEAYMRSFFETHFNAYNEAINEYRETAHREVIDPNFSNFEVAKPHLVANRLGNFVTRKSINFVPIVIGDDTRIELALAS